MYGFINPKYLTIKFYGITKIYDANNIGQTNYIILGTISGDIVDISNIYTSTFNDIYVGTNKLMYINTINLIGSSYYNYYTSISGFAYGNILGKPIIPTFYVNKYYDKTNVALIYYTLSGISDLDTPFITLNSSIYGLYYDYNANIGIPVTISNILLYGPIINTKNYSIINTVTLSGNIYPKLLGFTGIDKIYDQTIDAYVTLSGVITGDIIKYVGQFDTINVGTNKLIFVALSGISVPPNYLDIDTTLIIYYSFDLNSFNGVYVANMASGSPVYNNAQLTNTNMISTNSKIGSSCLVATTYDYSQYMKNVTLPPLTTNGFSMSFWIITPGNFREMLFQFVNGNYQFWFQGAEGGLACWIRDGNNAIKAFYLGVNNTYNWMHVVWTIQYDPTYNNSLHTLYINGVFKATQTSIYPLTTGYFYGNIMAGYNQPGYVPSWLGSLDDFRIYNRTLTQNDVTNLYNYTYVQVNINNNNNYQFSSKVGTSNIFQKQIIATFTGINKIYDGTYNAQSTYRLQGIIAGDIVDISNIYVSTFSSMYVSNSIPMYINYINLIGSSYFNYYTLSSSITSANIVKRLLVPTFTALGKVYDKTVYAPVTYTICGFVNNDNLYVDLNQNYYSNYANYSANPSSLINITNITLSGSMINNYTLTYYGFQNPDTNNLPISL
jgi:hypothetical protein